MNLEPAIQSEESQKEKNKYCILTCMCGIQKNGTDEPICYLQGSKGDADIEKRHADTVWEGEGEMNLENSMETYTLPYTKQTASGNLLYDTGSSNQGSVTTQRGGMGWEVGGRFKREGTYVYLWLIHVAIWKKLTQYCKAIILQLKINKLKKKQKKYRAKFEF